MNYGKPRGGGSWSSPCPGLHLGCPVRGVSRFPSHTLPKREGTASIGIVSDAISSGEPFEKVAECKQFGGGFIQDGGGLSRLFETYYFVGLLSYFFRVHFWPTTDFGKT